MYSVKKNKAATRLANNGGYGSNVIKILQATLLWVCARTSRSLVVTSRASTPSWSSTCKKLTPILNGARSKWNKRQTGKHRVSWNRRENCYK